MTGDQELVWSSLAMMTLDDGDTHAMLPSAQVEMARALIEPIEEVRSLELRLGTTRPDANQHP